MELFHPPARINDFALLPSAQAEAYARAWDEVMDFWLDGAVSDFQPPNGNGLFYNPRRDASPGNADTAPIGWEAFPKVLAKWFENEPDANRRRWEAAEILRPRSFNGQPLRRVDNGQLGVPVSACYRQQDEYCEWFVDRDPQTGDIRRITFTAEGPEYWQFLAMGTRPFFRANDPRRNLVTGDKDLVTELYRRYVNENVQTDDLFWNFDVAFFNSATNSWKLFARRGDYNQYNKWNTTHGCMHLTHPSNTLQAEINLAAGATVLRRKQDGSDVTDITELICCSEYGNVNRSSDPLIGSSVNEFARQNLSVSLANPIGLYISDINLGGFAGPNGENVRDAWHIDRSSSDLRMVLRARFELPENSPFTINQVRIGGIETSFGGQIVDHIQMVLNGLAKDRNSGAITKLVCQGKCCAHPQKAEFRTIVEIGDDCSQISPEDWQSFAPSTSPSPLCGGAAGFAADADNLDKETIVLSIEESDGLFVEPKTRNIY